VRILYFERDEIQLTNLPYVDPCMSLFSRTVVTVDPRHVREIWQHYSISVLVIFVFVSGNSKSYDFP